MKKGSSKDKFEKKEMVGANIEMHTVIGAMPSNKVNKWDNVINKAYGNSSLVSSELTSLNYLHHKYREVGINKIVRWYKAILILLFDLPVGATSAVILLDTAYRNKFLTTEFQKWFGVSAVGTFNFLLNTYFANSFSGKIWDPLSEKVNEFIGDDFTKEYFQAVNDLKYRDHSFKAKVERRLKTAIRVLFVIVPSVLTGYIFSLLGKIDPSHHNKILDFLTELLNLPQSFFEFGGGAASFCLNFNGCDDFATKVTKYGSQVIGFFRPQKIISLDIQDSNNLFKTKEQLIKCINDLRSAEIDVLTNALNRVNQFISSNNYNDPEIAKIFALMFSGDLKALSSFKLYMENLSLGLNDIEKFRESQRSKTKYFWFVAGDIGETIALAGYFLLTANGLEDQFTFLQGNDAAKYSFALMIFLPFYWLGLKVAGNGMVAISEEFTKNKIKEFLGSLWNNICNWQLWSALGKVSTLAMLVYAPFSSMTATNLELEQGSKNGIPETLIYCFLPFVVAFTALFNARPSFFLIDDVKILFSKIFGSIDQKKLLNLCEYIKERIKLLTEIDPLNYLNMLHEYVSVDSEKGVVNDFFNLRFGYSNIHKFLAKGKFRVSARDNIESFVEYIEMLHKNLNNLDEESLNIIGNKSGGVYKYESINGGLVN